MARHRSANPNSKYTNNGSRSSSARKGHALMARKLRSTYKATKRPKIQGMKKHSNKATGYNRTHGGGLYATSKHHKRGKKH